MYEERNQYKRLCGLILLENESRPLVKEKKRVREVVKKGPSHRNFSRYLQYEDRNQIL